MSIHTVPSRDFARDVGNAKRLTAEGPVLITDRGRPAFALLKIEDYYRLSGKAEVSIADLLAMPVDDIAFEPPRADIQLQIPEFD
ncbi:type II toxin-antitoxin system prevent-host-death family antitoxin [soil metagenome]